MSVTAATAVTATFIQLIDGWQATKLERLFDLLLDRVLQVVDLVLCFDESARDGVGEQGFTLGLEGGNFRAVQREGLLLFFLQRLAFVHDGFVEVAGGVIGQEGFDALKTGLEIGLRHNGLAEFAGFVGNDVGVG